MTRSKSQKKRQFNAMKHGAFVDELLILDEDEREFQNLHQGFIDDLKPCGRMEQELILEIAKLYWRKRRIERFFVNEANWLQAHPRDEELELARFVHQVIYKGTPCRQLWDHILQYLPMAIHDAIKNEFECPTEEYNDEWVERVKKSIAKEILHADAAISEARKRMRFVGERAAKLSELTAKRMAIEERIDAAIDRALRRYAQLKTFKEVMAVKDGSASRKISAG